MKVQAHHGVQFCDSHLAIPGGQDTERRNDGNPQSSLYQCDLRVQQIDSLTSFVRYSRACELLVDELPVWVIRRQRDQGFAIESRSLAGVVTNRSAVVRSGQHQRERQAGGSQAKLYIDSS